MNKAQEELIKELSLTPEEIQNAIEPYEIKDSGFLNDFFQQIIEKTLLKVLSNPKILIKKDGQNYPYCSDECPDASTALCKDCLFGAGYLKAREDIDRAGFGYKVIPFNEMEE